jgi:hypothetical protein
MGFAAVAGILVVLAGQAVPDPFVAQRAAAAALNPRSPAFTIALEGGRRQFRVGEQIPLVFSYDNLGRSTSSARDRSYRHFADAVLDRAEGTARPFADFERARLYIPGGVCCGVPGGVVGSRFGGVGFDANGVPFFLPDVKPPPPPKPPPATMTFLLNDGMRFDAPGRYRLYMSDRHEAERAAQSGTAAPPPLVSNVVEFEITARDEARDEETERQAIAILDGASDGEARTAAARRLRFLGSRRAIDEMARRLLSRGVDNYREHAEFEEGLFGTRDRAHAIAAVEAHVENASRPVSSAYLRTLAALRLTQSHPGRLTSSDKRQAVVTAGHQRLRALARAGVLVERLQATFAALASDQGTGAALPVSHVPLTPALAIYSKEVEAVLSRVSPDLRESVLTSFGLILVDDVRFEPMLKRLVVRSSATATRLANDLRAPSDPPAELESIQTIDRYVSAGYNRESNRRQYSVGGIHVSFADLGAVLSRFPLGTSFEWQDQLDHRWDLDRDADFRRVERVARRHGMSLRHR